MPQAVPALITQTVKYALSIGASKTVMALVGTLPAIFLRQRQVKKEQAAARRAALDRIQDRTLSFPADNAPWRFVLGKDVKVGCGIYPVGTSGPRGEFFHIIAIVANHEISAIKRIFIGDYELLTDAGGMANAGRFFLSQPRPQEHTATANASGQVTLPTPPTETPVRWVTLQGRFSVGGSAPVSGSTVSGLTPGTQYKFTYRTNSGSGTPLVSVSKYLGTSTQLADPLLTAELGAGVWPTTCRGLGVAYIRLTFSYSPDIFPNGVENITVIADGPACFDPRTGTNVLTDNIALHMRHVFTAPDMGNRPASRVDDASVIAAANACDEQVQIQASPALFQNRYFGAGVFTDDTDFTSVLDSLAAAMGGGYSKQGGKLVLRAGVYQAPALPALTENDLADDQLDLSTSVPRAALFNALTARFNDPLRNYEEAAVAPVRNATYASQDGAEIWADAGTFPWAKDNIAAQRLLKVQLESSRQGVAISANLNMRAYAVTPGDRVQLNFPTYGWNNKVFLCTKRGFSPTGAVRLDLREDGPSIYAWNLGEATAYDPLPNSTLPLPYTVAAPGALTLASGNNELLQLQDGTVVPRLRITWPRSTDPNVLSGGQVQVEWMRHDQTLDSVTGYPGKTEPLVGDATEALLQSVEEGFLYLARVRFRNGLGIYSPWTYSAPHRVEGKSAAPPDATALTVVAQPTGVRRFTVALPATLPLDIAGAQIRYQAGASIAWATATKLPQTIEIQPARDASGFVAFELNEPAAGQWTFEVRLLDNSGNPSPAGVRTTVTLGPVISDQINNAAASFSFAPSAFWDFVGTALGWTPIGATLTHTSTAMVVTSGGTDPIIRSPAVSIAGATYNRIRARIRRTGGSTWDGAAYYTTSGHGETGLFAKLIADPTAGAGNGWVVAEWDMAQLTNGGTDWLDSTITQFRLDLGTAATDVFEVDWIAVGRVGPAQLGELGFTGDLNATADIVLIAGSNVRVSGNRVDKAAGAGSWTAADTFYSRESITGGCIATGSVVAAGHRAMVGLDGAPASVTDWPQIDYLWHWNELGELYTAVAGVLTLVAGGYSAGEVFSVVYDDTTVRWLRNGALVRQEVVAAGQRLHLTGSLGAPVGGSSVGGMRFSPLPASTGIRSGGGNMLRNALFLRGSTALWTFAGAGSPGAGSGLFSSVGVFSDIYPLSTPLGLQGMYAFTAPGSPEGSGVEVYSEQLPASAGRWYQFSVFVNQHRSWAQLRLAFFDAAGTLLGLSPQYLPGNSIPTSGALPYARNRGTLTDASLGTIDRTVRLWTTMQAPAGTARVRADILTGRPTGVDDNYVFMAQAMLSEVAPNLATAAPFDPGAGIWQGAGALSGSNVTNYVNPSTINTREINPGAVTVVSDTKPVNVNTDAVSSGVPVENVIATLSYANTSGETQQVLVNYYALHDAFVSAASTGQARVTSSIEVTGVSYTGQPAEFARIARVIFAGSSISENRVQAHAGAFLVQVNNGQTMTVNYRVRSIYSATSGGATCLSSGIALSLAVLKR